MSEVLSEDGTVTHLLRGGRSTAVEAGDPAKMVAEIGSLKAEVARRDAILKAVLDRLPEGGAAGALRIESRLNSLEGELGAAKERFRELHALLRLLLEKIERGRESGALAETAVPDNLVARLNENVALMQAEIESLRHDLIRVEVEALSPGPAGDIESLRRDVLALSERRSADRAILAELRFDLNEMVGALSAQQQELVTEILARLDAQTDEDRQAIEQMKTSLATVQTGSQDAVDAVRAEIETLRVATGQRAGEITALRRTLASEQQANQKLRSEMSGVRASLQTDIESLRAASAQRAGEIVALRRTLASEQQVGVKVKRDLGTLKTELEAEAKKAEAMLAAHAEARDISAAAQAKLGKIGQEIALLREIGDRHGQKFDGQQREMGLLRDMVTETRNETTVLLRNVALLHDRLGAEVSIAGDLRADIAALRQARSDTGFPAPTPTPAAIAAGEAALGKLSEDLARLREVMTDEVKALREGFEGLGTRVDAETARTVRLRADLDALLKTLDGLPGHIADSGGLDALTKDINEVRGEFGQLRDRVAKFLFEQMRQARNG